jgi:hypothetical protein
VVSGHDYAPAPETLAVLQFNVAAARRTTWAGILRASGRNT